MTSESTAVHELIQEIARRVLLVEDEVVREMNEAIIGREPDLGHDATIRDELTRSSRSNLRRFLAVAQLGGVQGPPEEVPVEALDIVRSIARRGIEMDAIFHGYRRGQEVVWQRWLEVASDVVGSGPRFVAVLQTSLSLLFRYVDDVLSRAIAIAQHEREELLGGALARRGATVRLIIEDAPIDVGTASEHLGYELSLLHTGLVLWAETPDPPQGSLESAAGAIARAVGVGRPLTVADDASVLWAWLGSTSGVDVTAMRDALRAHAPSVRVAVGPTESGVGGFRRTHDAALTVQRLLAGLPGGEQMATYDELEVVVLAGADERRALDFVAKVLGPLAADDPTTARLRETLRVHLDEAEHAPRAAARLHLHRNTVLQRVARASDLLGHAPGERRLAVSVALELSRRLGPRAH